MPPPPWGAAPQGHRPIGIPSRNPDLRSARVLADRLRPTRDIWQQARFGCNTAIQQAAAFWSAPIPPLAMPKRRSARQYTVVVSSWSPYLQVPSRGPRREQPCRRRAAKQRDKLPPSQSIEGIRSSYQARSDWRLSNWSGSVSRRANYFATRRLLANTGGVRSGSMLLKKDFEGGLCAIMIREKPKTENMDSRNCLPREKSCTLIVVHRLFQQHRSKPAVTASQH